MKGQFVVHSPSVLADNFHNKTALSGYFAVNQVFRPPFQFPDHNAAPYSLFAKLRFRSNEIFIRRSNNLRERDNIFIVTINTRPPLTLYTIIVTYENFMGDLKTLYLL